MRKLLLLLFLFSLIRASAQEKRVRLDSLFNKAFEREGGLLKKVPITYQGIAKFALEAGKKAIQFNRKMNDSFPKVYINIINSYEINAASTIRNGKYFIGINLGTLIIIQDVFFRMLSSKNIFPDIGDTSKESSPLKINSFQVHSIDEYNKINKGYGNLAVTPIGIKRHYLAETLAYMLLSFIINHEYGHIAHGHIRYGQSKLTDYIHYENGPEKIDGNTVSILFRQVKETDADYFATLYGLRYASHVVNRGIKMDPQIQEFYSNWKTYLRFWIISTYTLFKIFGDPLKSDSIPLNLPHPPPALRTFLIQTDVGMNLSTSKKVDSASLIKICIDSWDESDKAFAEISNSKFDYYEMKFAITKSSLRKMTEIINYFPTYRSIIQKYSYVTLTTPP